MSERRKTYDIYYPVDKGINFLCNSITKYEKVASVVANSHKEVFSIAQNHNRKYEALQIRSMCVGDLIISNDQDDNDMWMVAGLGHTKLDKEQFNSFLKE